MMIPKADKAVIAKDKLCDYLLNPVHRRGGSKAKLLLSMGYSGDDWQRLETDLRVHHPDQPQGASPGLCHPNRG